LNIKISGCHSTVSALALPETLSPEISHDITISLRAQLSSQLLELLRDKPARSNTQHLRNTSETGHSAASSNEGSAKYPSSHDTWMRLGHKN
jgi:hypothetical protein